MKGSTAPGPAPREERDPRAWAIGAALVAGMLLAAVGGFLFVSQFLMAPSASPVVDSGPDRKALGSPNAPVTVVVYSDFQ